MMYEKEVKRVTKEIKRMVRRKKISAENRTVIFGAGENAKIVIKILRENGIEIQAVVDNDPKKLGKWCSGVGILSPEVLNGQRSRGTVVLTYSYFWREISLQLESYGMVRDQDFFVLNAESVLVRSYFGQYLAVRNGLRYYGRLQRKYSEGHKFFVCPYTGTGDLYLIGLLFHKFIERQGIDDYVFIVVSTACRKVGGLFQIKNIEQLKREKAEAIIKAGVFMPDLCDVTVLNDSWSSVYMNPTQWLRGYKGLNFTDMFRYAVFELEDRAEFDFPRIESAGERAQRFFREQHLQVGKTVILAPYSNTLTELPNRFWELLAETLIGKGYSVCTNSCGKQEPAVRGTEAVFFPLDLAAQIVSLAGNFIGIRSGFCDIVSSAQAVKVILYEKDGFFYEGSTFDYFSLNQMGLCRDAVELFYEGIEETVGNIMEKFE